jgi:5-methyltetrahydrofolate--homocysteine methyltransferase
MTAADRLQALLARRIVVLDGAVGPLPSGAAGVLHAAYLAAGADIIKTDTFRATTYELNAVAARIARRAVDHHRRRTPGLEPLVAGVIGPVRGSRGEVQAAHRTQARGLIDGAVDLLLVETIMDASHATAAAAALRDEFDDRGAALPVMFSATVDRNGRLLSGDTLDAFVAAISDARPLSIGLNCAHGARDIVPHVARLASLTGGYVSCHPSAGLPDADGRYPESPADVAAVLRDLAERGLVNIVGGCCGTTPDYTRAVAAAVGTVPVGAIRTARGGSRPSPADRS